MLVDGVLAVVCAGARLHLASVARYGKGNRFRFAGETSDVGRTLMLS